ncbi:MAG: CHASE2 domain-containing protein [Methylococcales bacterium]|nr:CHASE2 domain-containing protein [Methylococcales bacterium]
MSLKTTENEKNKYKAVIIALVIIACLLLANFFSLFKPVNYFFNDTLMRYTFGKSTSKKIVVLEAHKDYSLQGDETWLPLLKNLLAEDVLQVVFNFLPEQASKEFYQLAANSHKVVFARRFEHKGSHLNELVLQALPQTTAGLTLNLGLIQNKTHESGVYRHQLDRIKLQHGDFPSMELITAQQVLKQDELLPKGQYAINFSGGLKRLPIIDIERVLQSGLVSELVAGRTVFIAVHDLEAINEYYTPISSTEGLIPAVFFHAFALDTLLSKRSLTPVHQAIVWLLIVAITIKSLFVFQWLSFRLSWLVSVSLSVVYVGVAWVLRHQFFFVLPLTELLLAQWLTLAWVWRYQLVQEKRFLDDMLFDLSLRLQEKVFPVSFYHSEAPWEQLIDMLNQTLDFKRLIFLERVEDEHRLKEISAFNCQIYDIDEVRRDYERAPYSTAINENRAILLEKNYFKKIDSNELEYLVPLIFAGKVLGFWAFTIDKSRMHGNSKFSLLIAAYTQQISEILHYRNEWKKHTQAEGNKLLSYLRIGTNDSSYKMISQSITLMDRRISELQEVFNNVVGSSILYDLFGRVLLVNKRMENVGAEANIPPYNLSMLEFVIKITQFDTPKAQHLLQQIIFDRKPMSLMVSCFDEKSSYMLHIKPLQTNQTHAVNNFSAEANVFQMVGVLCELVDVTEMKKISTLKEHMFERFNFQMHNDMASVSFGLSLLKSIETTPEDKEFALESIEGKVDETLKTLDVVSEQMNKNLTALLDSTLECYPIDVKFSLKQAIKQCKKLMDEKSIKFVLFEPKLLSLVFASPRELENILATLLTEMLDDTYQSGKLSLELEEKMTKLYLRFKNTGIGFSDNKLKHVNNFSSNDVNQDGIDELNHVIHCVKQWDGHLQLSSKVGEGSAIELSLRCFLCNENSGIATIYLSFKLTIITNGLNNDTIKKADFNY